MLGFGQLGLLAIGQLPSNPAAAVFSSFNDLPRRTVLSAAVIATTFAGFVAPQPAQSQPFTQFSLPLVQRTNLPDEQPSTLFEILPPVTTTVFSSFSQPQIARINLPDEQTSTFFEILPPALPPFAGFAQFTDYLLAKKIIFTGFQPFLVAIPPPDTHDGGWVKKRKKRQDPLELKIQEEKARRAALELAIYGPEVEYKIEIPRFEEPKKQADIGNLPQIIASVQHQNYMDELKKGSDDDEDELNIILKDIL